MLADRGDLRVAAQHIDGQLPETPNAPEKKFIQPNEKTETSRLVYR
jgi:hypothetical protein